METFRNEPESRMEEEPFFKGVAHCESWVDRALLDLEVEDFPNVDPKLLEKAKSDLEYGKLYQKKYLLNNLITGQIRTPESLTMPK